MDHDYQKSISTPDLLAFLQSKEADPEVMSDLLRYRQNYPQGILFFWYLLHLSHFLTLKEYPDFHKEGSMIYPFGLICMTYQGANRTHTRWIEPATKEHLMA